MNNFFLHWLSLSLSGSMVAAALVLLKPLLQQFTKTWQYYLWLLVILRLLIPFSPDTSIVGGLFQQMETHLAVQNETAENVPDINFSEGTQSFVSPELVTANLHEPLAAVTIFSLLKHHIWGALWLTVAVILLIRKIIGYGQFIKAVKKESKIVTDGQLPVALQMVSAAMGIKKRFYICTNSLIRAPMLIGFIRPMVVLPNETMTPSELMLILRHELTHYHRKDFLYKWLVEIAVCLHWFNPLAYWVRKQINQDCEFSCDESVVSCLSNEQRQTYGETLLNSIVANNLGSTNVVSLSLNQDGELIQKRLYAIMKYHHKSKWIIFVAAVLTSVLLCGTVFAGAYTVAAIENVQTSPSVSPIRIRDKEISPGGKISLGSQILASGTECTILLTWTGNHRLTVLCASLSGTTKSVPVKNGKTATLQIKVGGEYTISVRNDNAQTIGNVNGTIKFKQSTQSKSSNKPASLDTPTSQTVIYENVEMRRYIGADGHPYIHAVKVNETTKKITGYEYGMLAFDKNGNPLKINWWSLDTKAKSTYFYLNEATNEIAPAKTYDEFGGWSLNLLDTDLSVKKIAYVLYCDKKITFEDGTVWTNPDFDNWCSNYKGKKVDINILKNYYPYEQKITFNN